MRAFLRSALAVGVVLALLPTVRSDEAADMTKLLDKASAALGGEARVAKLKGVTQKGKGTLQLQAVKAAFEETSYWQTPDQYRFDLVLDIDGKKLTEQFVINGAKGWLKINDTTVDLPKNFYTSMKDSLYAISLAMRPMDAKAKGYKLSPLGEIKVEGQDAVGIQIAIKGRPDVNLYVDKKTGLPLKCEVRSQDGLEQNKEVLHELYFSEYKKVGDLKTFTKLTWIKDGNKYLVREMTEVKAEESLDADLFGKP